jgi:hypothetical protein
MRERDEQPDTWALRARPPWKSAHTRELRRSLVSTAGTDRRSVSSDVQTQPESAAEAGAEFFKPVEATPAACRTGENDLNCPAPTPDPGRGEERAARRLPVRGPEMSTRTSCQRIHSGCLPGDGGPERQPRGLHPEAPRGRRGVLAARWAMSRPTPILNAARSTRERDPRWRCTSSAAASAIVAAAATRPTRTRVAPGGQATVPLARPPKTRSGCRAVCGSPSIAAAIRAVVSRAPTTVKKVPIGTHSSTVSAAAVDVPRGRGLPAREQVLGLAETRRSSSASASRRLGARRGSPSRRARRSPSLSRGRRPRRASTSFIVREIIASDPLGTSSILVPKPSAIARKLGRFRARRGCLYWSRARPRQADLQAKRPTAACRHRRSCHAGGRGFESRRSRSESHC